MPAPSLRSDRPRLASSWPLFLLGAAIVVMGVAAFQAQDAVRSNRQAATRLAHDYAAFGAWAYAQHAESEMKEIAARALAPIQHRFIHQDLDVPDAALLPRYFQNSYRGGPVPAYEPTSYFGFMLGADTLKVVGAPLSAEARRRIVDSVRARSVGRDAVVDPETYLLSNDARGAQLVAFALMPTKFGPIAYGFVIDSTHVAALLGHVFDHSTLLPPSLVRGFANRDLLDVQVRARGAALFATGSWPSQWMLAAGDRLSDDMAALEVRTAVRPKIAPSLIIGGLPRSRLPFIAGGLLLALALAGVAVAQLRREQSLARLRADFVASVSHELRTPLAQIRLYVETLRLGRVSTEEQREWSLATIDRETSRLAQLVENVLSFSRATHAGPRGTPTAPLDFSSEVADAVRAFEMIAATRRVQVHTEIEPALIVLGERDPLRQVLFNLLDNAVKFGPTGQTVRVRLARVGESARLTVDDEGPGIPGGEREAVFLPFHRGTSRAAATVGGSGIGLSVVREIIEAHGGRVFAADAPKGGARLIVEIGLSGIGTRGSRVPTDDAAAGDSRFPIPDGSPAEMHTGE